MEMGNQFIGSIGALEHSIAHAELTAELSYDIIFNLGYPRREAELAAIAGYLHDIGNLIHRYRHGTWGAIMAFEILSEMGMEPDEVTTIMGAIANHEEHAGGFSVSNVSAAVILADKSDVNQSRVRKVDTTAFTDRDRVNYAAKDSSLFINAMDRLIVMNLTIDTDVCSVMDYFEIFLTKMMMCKRAAEHLGCRFDLIINGLQLL
ncbi:MAG: HD domain-containing protein [Syntrophomonadaceae bacterium]|nr:HD domain-containing protein [Syntrophomonadaceae bacterium]